MVVVVAWSVVGGGAEVVGEVSVVTEDLVVVGISVVLAVGACVGPVTS